MQATNKAKKIRRYILPLLAAAVISTIIMIKTGIISANNLWYGLLLPAILELMFIIVCIINIFKIIRRYRGLKREGWQTLDALQNALEVAVSPRAARLATLEPRLYYALYLSYKKKSLTDIMQSFSTRKDSYTFFVRVIIFLCFLEIAAVTILIPDRWLFWKVLHLVLGIWAILFLWADYRAIKLYNHLITPEGLKFRLGLRCCQEISWKDIAIVRRISQSSPDGAMSPCIPKSQPDSYYLGLGDICNLEITLQMPCSFQRMFNDIPAVNRILLSLEKPDDFIGAIKFFKPGLCDSENLQSS